MGLWSWVFDVLSGERSRGTSPTPAAPYGSEPGGVLTATVTDGHCADLTADDVWSWWAPEGATLTEPVRTQPAVLSPETRALENLLVSHFDGHNLKMPPLMHSAERVLARLRDPQCSVAELTRELSDDPVIVAAVLRLANSPMYRGVDRITTLTAAVGRVGTKAIRTLLMHESMRSAVFGGDGRDELAQTIWTRSVASAHIMYGLSRFTGVDPDDAFLIGLLHDIGCVIALRIVRSDEAARLADVDADLFEYLCDQCHQEFGELVADAWKLPPTVAALIARHHDFPQPDDPLRVERLQLQLCDMIAALLAYSPYMPYDLMNTRVVQALKLTDDQQFLNFLAELPARLEEAFDEM